MMSTTNGGPDLRTLSIQLRIIVWAIITLFLCGVTFCSGLLAYRVKLNEDTNRNQNERIGRLEKILKPNTP